MIKRYSTISIKIKRSKDKALIGLKKIKRMKRYSNISFKDKRSKETINIKRFFFYQLTIHGLYEVLECGTRTGLVLELGP